MKKYISYNTKISLKDAPYMSNFFPFYDPSGRGYLDSGETEEVIVFDKFLEKFIEIGLKKNKT